MSTITNPKCALIEVFGGLIYILMSLVSSSELPQERRVVVMKMVKGAICEQLQ